MIATANEIHRGESTHSHDHFITLHSLRTMNATARSPAKPIPPVLELELLLDMLRCVL